LLSAVQSGEIDVEAAIERLKILPYENLQFARIDHQRCPGKTADQIAAIFARLATSGDTVLATRADEDAYEAVKVLCPNVCFYREARALVLHSQESKTPSGSVAVVSAGTADQPVALLKRRR